MFGEEHAPEAPGRRARAALTPEAFRVAPRRGVVVKAAPFTGEILYAARKGESSAGRGVDARGRRRRFTSPEQVPIGGICEALIGGAWCPVRVMGRRGPGDPTAAGKFDIRREPRGVCTCFKCRTYSQLRPIHAAKACCPWHASGGLASIQCRKTISDDGGWNDGAAAQLARMKAPT